MFLAGGFKRVGKVVGIPKKYKRLPSTKNYKAGTKLSGDSAPKKCPTPGTQKLWVMCC
jgi:hypothetical protein